MPTYSIIVPVYNTKVFLPKCMESLRNQTYKDFEVILVDDCSTDGSYELCCKASQEDCRFITIKQPKNKRLSATRNLGLEHAVGKYVLFVDSDDYVENDFLESISKHIKDYNCDLLTWGMYYDVIKNSGEISIMPSPLNSQELILAEDPSYEEWNNIILNTFFASSCNKIYRTDIIRENGLKYDEMCVDFEDLIFNMRYACYVKNFIVLPKSFYHYRIPEGQIAPLKRRWGLVNRFEVSRKVYDAVDDFILSQKCGDKRLDKLMLYAYKAYNNEIEFSYRTKCFEDFKKDTSLLITDEKYYKTLEYVNNGTLKKLVLPLKILLRLRLKNLLALFLGLIMKQNIKND